MASGKSTVGKELASRLGWKFVDLDELVVHRSGLSISELFRRYGEGTFRQLESSALVSTIEMNQVVIATGGGAPCYNENIDVLSANGTSVFLKGAVDILVKRIHADTSVRPIVSAKNDEDLRAFIIEHLKGRMLYYEQADVTIDIDQSVGAIVDIILEQVDLA